MKKQYKLVNIQTIKGIGQAENLKAKGWKIETSNLVTIQFSKEKIKKNRSK